MKEKAQQKNCFHIFSLTLFLFFLLLFFLCNFKVKLLFVTHCISSKSQWFFLKLKLERKEEKICCISIKEEWKVSTFFANCNFLSSVLFLSTNSMCICECAGNEEFREINYGSLQLPFISKKITSALSFFWHFFSLFPWDIHE